MVKITGLYEDLSSSKYKQNSKIKKPKLIKVEEFKE